MLDRDSPVVASPRDASSNQVRHDGAVLKASLLEQYVTAVHQLTFSEVRKSASYRFEL